MTITRSPAFIPGLELSERFYRDVVSPLICNELPYLKHSAALIGPGSEVLGFDTEMSTDHDWGPRVLLFLDEDDCDVYAQAIHTLLSRRLPRHFLGFATDFEGDNGDGPIRYRVPVTTFRRFVAETLGFDIRREIEPADWLTFPQQKLRTITAGAVFRDDIGLQVVRERFNWYPRDVWLYMLAAGWTRIGQEDHLMGRAGYVGDEIGATIIASRLVRDLMQLCFLMERQYAPYPKWFGTAFSRLACAAELMPHFRAAQLAPTWQVRERHIIAAGEHVAQMHNAMRITAHAPASSTGFHDRPFQIINSELILKAIRAEIRDEVVKQLADRRLIGNIDQFSDSTDLKEDTAPRDALRGLFAP